MLRILSILFCAGLTACTAHPSEEAKLKPRLVVLTDIGPSHAEPDDTESTVHLLSYADRFEIELIACNVGWNSDPYPAENIEYLYKVIDAYGKDVENLRKRSGQTDFLSLDEENGKQQLGYWPSVEYIRSRAMLGSIHGGIGALGEENSSPGSDMLIKLADEDDPRPIYVCAWGGANTLSQAIWKVQQPRSAEEVRAFVRKFRLYTITDQDMGFPMRQNLAYSSHQWLRRDFANDLLFVWDESAWLNQNGLGRANWDEYAAKIQGHGAMGEAYPRFHFGVEGDTPSFLHVLPNGLNDPEDPSQVSWGGYHEQGISRDSVTSAWTNWEEAVKAISDSYEKKFYPDTFRDFAARMQWAAEGTGNLNPMVYINGKGGLEPVRIQVSAGSEIKVDASASSDPDGDQLTFNWWFQNFVSKSEYPSLNGDETSVVTVNVPNDLKGQVFHLVCEVHDNGPWNLPAYRRIILEIK